MKNESLIKLYQNTSKHSNYQNLHPLLSNVIKQDDLKIVSRYEKERAYFINKYINISNFHVADIGGNTGYFSFESLENKASKVDYYEGNNSHAEFVNIIKEKLNLNINIFNKYIDFDKISFENSYDLIFNLNVMHHIGDDFGDVNLSKEKALISISNGIKNLSSHTKYMIFQMGFCWKGNVENILFENGLKKELINFVESATDGYWDIMNIGIPELKDGQIFYSNCTNKNIKRNNEIGEFLNRPLFILKSKFLAP